MVAVEGDELVALKDNTYGLALDNKPTSKDEEVYTALSTDSSTPTLIVKKDHEATEENDTTTIYYGFYITPDTPYGTYTGAVVNYEAEMTMATVIYNGNGLYFNDNEAQTTNTVKYVVDVTDKTEKYSNTPNLDKYTGEQISGEYIHFGTYLNSPIEIPGAAKVHVSLKYGIYDGFYNQDNNEYWAYMTIWQGNKPNYTAANDYDKGIKQCGTMTTTDGRINGYDGYTNNGQMIPINVECDITGDAVTFGFWTQPGGGPDIGYGYYATVTGYDENGNIIYLNGNTPKKGEYKEPARELPYKFLGWSEDKDATTATYESKNDIELNLPLTMGETTELYAIWQHATKIHFDGNGSASGEMPDKLLAAGKGTSLCNNYTRTGYAFNNWNTEPDGSGESYGQCYWYTAPTDQSIELTLYAQWSPATTIIYDGNGGEGSQQQQTIRAGETSSIYGNWGYFNKNGYIFSHWNTKPDGSGETYHEGDQLTASDQSTTITLYVQWVPATTIIYDGNGGEGSQQQQNIRAGETSSIYGNRGYFNKNGYIFSHWNTKPDGSGETYHEGDQFTASDQSTTITLYAQWIYGVMLDTGLTVNAKLKRLAGNSSASFITQDTSVTTIARASTLPADFIPTNDNTISIDGSANPVYAWYDADTTTVYYYAESDEIMMNPNSSNMFYNFRNLSDATSIADWDTSYVANMTFMFYYAGYNATTFSLDLSSWDTSEVTKMTLMFYYAGYNATTWSIGDLSSWDTSEVTSMTQMFQSAGYNATTWSIGDLSSWDTSKVTGMNSMFGEAGRNATTWSIGDLSSWDTSKVTNMTSMFYGTGRNATTWSIGDLSSWDTSKVTGMTFMFYYAGYNATTFSLDLSSWDTSKVTGMNAMFFGAGSNATTWSITIPQKTGDINNTTSAFYGQDSSIYATPASGKSFTLASQANSNTTSTTESLNSVNNVEATIQGGSSRNYSAYTTEDVEDTENADDTGLDTTSSTPSRQEPLGEYQSSTTTSTEDTNIIIPILIVAAITLGTSTLGFLIYKSCRREDE